MPALLIAVGLALLVAGGELVVRGAARLAVLARIPPLVVGLTVVAFGTSSPELAVAIGSALRGEPDFVTGNIVGSTIYNVLLVLGSAALIVPLVVQRKLVQWDVPVMVVASGLLFAFALDGVLARWEGVVMVTGLGAYLGATVWWIRRRREDASAERDEPDPGDIRPGGWGVARDIAILVVGIGLLVLGADMLVSGAVEIAETLGVDRLVIGLTIVGLGTSTPELATSIVAAVRGERSIAVGNIVGSNIMNILLIAGLTTTIAPDGVTVAPALVRLDLPVMLAVVVACLPIFFSGHRLDRWEGGVFVIYAVAYTAYIVLDATGHRAIEPFSIVMLVIVLPLTAVTLLVIAVRELGSRRRREAA